MAAIWVAYDPNAPEGEQLPAEVVAEIRRVAPSSVETGSMTTDKIRDDAVTSLKLAPGAVDTLALGNGAVDSTKLATDAVTTVKIDDDAVTAAKAGIGVVTSYDSSGNAVERREVDITSVGYAALSPPDPNTYYNLID